MTKLRAWAVLAVVAMAVIALGGWFLALSPQKAKVADLHSQVADEVQRNQTLMSQIKVLKAQQSEVPAEQARIAQIKGRIPGSPQLTGYVRTLTDLAHATNVELVSISPSKPAQVQVAAPKPSAGSTSATAPAGGNLSAIAVVLDVVGDYYSIQQFLSKLEDTQRATIVNAISLNPGSMPQPDSGAGGPAAAPGGGADTSWRTLDAQISVSVFMSPLADGAAAGGAAPPPATAAPSPGGPANTTATSTAAPN